MPWLLLLPIVGGFLLLLVGHGGEGGRAFEVEFASNVKYYFLLLIVGFVCFDPTYSVVFVFVDSFVHRVETFAGIVCVRIETGS